LFPSCEKSVFNPWLKSRFRAAIRFKTGAQISVAAGILPAVAGGILAARPETELQSVAFLLLSAGGGACTPCAPLPGFVAFIYVFKSFF
jgi:hypothetical protein